MTNLNLKDDSVQTTTHGYYECPECKKTLYHGGGFIHIPGCSRVRDDRFVGLVYHVGPNCPEYAEAVELGDLRPRAFNMGYDAYPNDRLLFGESGAVADWYGMGWATARMHESPAFAYKSDSYPYGERQPYKVKVLKTVESDLPFTVLEETAVEGEVYEVYTNSHGAMSAYLPSGKRLGIKPGEFEIIEWYEDEELEEGHGGD